MSDNTGMDNTLLTTDQAKAKLGVTDRTLRRRAQKGDIQRFMVDGKVHYRIPDRPDAGQVDNPNLLLSAFKDRSELVRKLESEGVKKDKSISRLRGFLAGFILALVVVGGGAILLYGYWQGAEQMIIEKNNVLIAEQQRVIKLEEQIQTQQSQHQATIERVVKSLQEKQSKPEPKWWEKLMQIRD